jgi:hypothetical protein
VNKLLIALPTAGLGDASMQVDEERVLKAQVPIALLTAAESDVSTQVGVKRVPEAQVLIALLTAGASDGWVGSVVEHLQNCLLISMSQGTFIFSECCCM